MAYPVTIGGETFAAADFAPFAYAANWERLLTALGQYLVDVVGLAGVQTATVTGTAHAGDPVVTTYTYTTPVEPPDGGAIWIEIPETPQGTVNLERSGGATRTLRNSLGSVLGADQLTPSQLYLAKRNSGVFELVTFDLTQWFLNRINLVGSAATLDGRATRGGSILARISGGNIGRWLFQCSTAGSLVSVMELKANGNAEIFGHLDVASLAVGGASGFYSSTSPPPTTDALIQIMDEMGGTGAYETLRAAVAVANTHPHQIFPSDTGRHSWCNVNGAFIDCDDMLPHETKPINVGTAGTVTIWTGRPGVSFTDRTSEQVRVSKGRYRVHRGQGNEWEIEAVNGKTITDASLVTYPLPTYAHSLLGLGYSNLDRVLKNMAGWRDQFLAWGENPSLVNILSPVGASSMLKGGESNYPNNHWWDWETGTPGPNIALLQAEVAANPASPVPEMCVVHIGYADMNLWTAAKNPLGAALTEAEMVGHWADCLEHIRGPSCLDLPDLLFMICPMANRGVAVWDEKWWYALRRMMLKLCEQHPTLAVRGPDSFDLRYIPADYHPTLRSQKIFSARIARWHETILGNKSAFLGPKIVDWVQDSATSTRLIIDPKIDDGNGEGLIFPGRYNASWLSLPPLPGLALLPPGSNFIDYAPIAITNTAMSFSAGPPARYTITLTHASQADVRPCWPWGFCNEFGEDPARCIRSSVTGEPLMTFFADDLDI